MKEYSKLYFDLQKNVSSNFDIEGIKKGITKAINTEPSTYEDLKKEVRRVIKLKIISLLMKHYTLFLFMAKQALANR